MPNDPNIVFNNTYYYTTCDYATTTTHDNAKTWTKQVMDKTSIALAAARKLPDFADYEKEIIRIMEKKNYPPRLTEPYDILEWCYRQAQSDLKIE